MKLQRLDDIALLGTGSRDPIGESAKTSDAFEVVTGHYLKAVRAKNTY